MVLQLLGTESEEHCVQGYAKNESVSFLAVPLLQRRKFQNTVVLGFFFSFSGEISDHFQDYEGE